MREITPLPEMSKDELIEAVERGMTVMDALEADIERWKERCRQEIAFKVSVVEERDALRARIADLEQEHAALRPQLDQP